MRFTCLLAFVSLIVVSAAQTPAQSRPNKAASEAATTATYSSTRNSSGDLIRIVPNPRVDLGLRSDDGSQVGILPNNPAGSRAFVSDADRTWELGDVNCLAIRSYRVVRDSPHSDSTHPDGYTTCVPAARFHYYTAVAHER